MKTGLAGNRRRLCAVGAIWAGATVLLSGCIFTPRVPEPPGAGVQIDYLPQSSPANVWANLGKSLEASHAPGWEANISQDEFSYIPDDAARDQFPPDTFVGWDRDREINFINGFYNSGVSIIALMVEDGFSFPPPSGSEMTVENIVYYLTVTNDADGSQVRYRGQCDVIFRLEANFWYIYQWRDLQGESDPITGQPLSTMGVLRGSFGSK